MSDDDQITPHPPATPEFGHVVAGGPGHHYPGEGRVSVTKLSVGEFDNNVYVIATDDQAVVVDGANEPERILAELGVREVVAILQTHNHADHTQALPALIDASGAPVRAHPADTMPVPAIALADGDRIRLGPAEIVAIHTPGHTPGSTCYLLGSRLFTGDTLFPAGPGATQDRGAFEMIMGSLDRLFSLPDSTHVSPGHGLDTTIGRERPYLEVWRARGW